jgi:multisubunit Na+/H+ antiporter MnhC subunit
MLKVYSGGALLVLGILALLAQPVAGVVMIGAGLLPPLSQRQKPVSSLASHCLLMAVVVTSLVVAMTAFRVSAAAMCKRRYGHHRNQGGHEYCR